MPARRSFIGRQDERDERGRLLDAAVAGRGGSVALLGDAGLGKSSLIEILTTERDEAMRVIRLTGVEVESDLAYAGTATLVAQAGGAIGELDVQAVMGRP